MNGGYVQVSTAAKEDGSNVPHQQLSAQVVISQPGYVYTYLSNESLTPIEVYFDDFTVQQIKSPVVQQEDFYPFGLTFNEYQRESSVPNKYLYNKGSERQDDLGLNVYQTHFRILDPAIGRWWQVDPKPSYDMSVYNSMDNNNLFYTMTLLVNIVDIEHRRGFLGLGKKETLTYNNGKLTTAGGQAYTGKVNGFLGKAVNALNGISGTATGNKMFSWITKSSANTFKVMKGATTEFKASDVTQANWCCNCK